MHDEQFQAHSAAATMSQSQCVGTQRIVVNLHKIFLFPSSLVNRKPVKVIASVEYAHRSLLMKGLM